MAAAEPMPRRVRSRPRRKYVGAGVWETELPDGDYELEFALNEAELADLRAEAAATGLTVSEVAQWRLFGDGVLVEGCTTKLTTIATDLKQLQRGLYRLGAKPSQLIDDSDTTAVLVATAMTNLQDLTKALDAFEAIACVRESQSMLATITALRIEIDKTMRPCSKAGRSAVCRRRDLSGV